MKRSLFLLIKQQRRAIPLTLFGNKRIQKSSSRKDPGLLTPTEIGETAHTDPKKFRSSDPSAMVQDSVNILKGQRAMAYAQQAANAGLDSSRFTELLRGRTSDDLPRNEREEQFVEDAMMRELQLPTANSDPRHKDPGVLRPTPRQQGTFWAKHGAQENANPFDPDDLAAARPPGGSAGGAGAMGTDVKALPYTAKIHRSLNRFDETKLRRQLDNPQYPTAKEYNKMYRRVLSDASQDERMEEYQNRLIDEHGMYNENRLDAYMLGDESAFPSWVRNLGFKVRDRVMYGNLGLTEDDEVLRQNLSRMDPAKRSAEWTRLKAARAYREGTERPLSPTEMRDAKFARRKHKWLEFKRGQKAAALRTMAMRKPHTAETVPNGAIDHSKRIALIAQYVEEGIDTNGEWPLTAEKLVVARRKRQEKEARESFLSQPKLDGVKEFDPHVRQSLKMLDRFSKPIGRVPRKTYAYRIQGIINGDRDEHGRHTRKWKTQVQRPTDPTAPKSAEEMTARKMLSSTPRPFGAPHRKKRTQGWASGQYDPRRKAAAVSRPTDSVSF